MSDSYRDDSLFLLEIDDQTWTLRVTVICDDYRRVGLSYPMVWGSFVPDLHSLSLSFRTPFL